MPQEIISAKKIPLNVLTECKNFKWKCHEIIGFVTYLNTCCLQIN